MICGVSRQGFLAIYQQYNCCGISIYSSHFIIAFCLSLCLNSCSALHTTAESYLEK